MNASRSHDQAKFLQLKNEPKCNIFTTSVFDKYTSAIVSQMFEQMKSTRNKKSNMKQLRSIYMVITAMNNK